MPPIHTASTGPDNRTSSPESFAGSGSRVEVYGGRVFWIACGEYTKRAPIVFMHGIPTWSWIWRNVMSETGRSNRSVAFDLPGFGLSQLDSDREFNVATLAGMLEEAIDNVLGSSSRPVLVAHDFGALIACELIARDAERYESIVLTNTSLRPDAWTGSGSSIDLLTPLRIPVIGQVSMALARPWMLKMAASQFVHDPVDPDWFDGYWYPFELGFGQSLARFFQQRSVQPGDFERWRDALSTYPGRSAVVWGGQDRAFGKRELDDIVGLSHQSMVSVIERANHFLMEDRPRVLARYIDVFLNDAAE